MIQEEDYDKSYAVIKTIFKHKGNDGHYYPFIYVDWFEVEFGLGTGLRFWNRFHPFF
jgi:hypothetical protein